MEALYELSEYAPGKHRIFYAVPDAEWFYFSHTTNIALGEMIIDEIDPDNKAICQDLKKYGTYTKIDDTGENKYHIEIEGGEPVLYEKDGWEEAIEDVL